MRDAIITLKLTKVLLKSVFSDFSLNKNKSKKGINGLMMVILAVALIPTAASFCLIVGKMYDALHSVPGGYEKLIISLVVSGISAIYFIIGIFYALGVFYYSNDNERVFALPLKPNQILTARFLTIVVYEYIFLALMFLPVVITYGVKSGAAPLFYIYLLVVGALVSFIPICICTILLMFLMRFSSLFKNRDMVNIVGSFVLVGVILYMNSTITGSLTKLGNADAANLISNVNDKFSSVLSIVFAGTSFAADALTNYSSINGLLYLLIFIAACLVWYFIFLFFGRLLYKKGVLGLNSSSSKKKALTKSDFERSCRPRNKYVTYMLKDMRVILRTPVFLMNNLSTIILLPVILIVTFAVPGLKEDPDITFLLSGFSNGSLNFSASYANIAMAAFFAIGAVNASFSGIASSAVSREGSNAYYMKFIPAKFENQLFAKAGLGFAGGFISSVILITMVSIVFKANPLFAIVGLLISVFPTVAINLTGIILDAYFPLLNWDNEQKAVKQNMNVLINMVIGAGLSAAAVFAAIKYFSNVYALMGILVGVSALLILALGAVIVKYTDKFRSKIS